MSDLTRHSAAELIGMYAARQTTAMEVVEDYARRMKADTLNAYITPTLERAREDARRVDERRQAGKPLGLLAGIPIALKDNLATTFAPTTCGSKMLRDYVSPYDATVVQRLMDAGAIILGKTNMDEFAMGSSNETSAFGPVHNPYDADAVPGGSSGGSAAAVAGHLACLALGSDTGGSVRQPAAFCGCVGFKPSYGAVSRYGLVAFASSLDQIGPLGRTVDEVSILFRVIAGPDERDSTSIRTELSRPDSGELWRPLRLGVLRFPDDGVDYETAIMFERFLQVCRQEGHRVKEVTLRHLDLGIATYYVIANAEASANLARYDGVKYGHRAHAPTDLQGLYVRSRGEGFGREVKRRIMLGTYVLSAGYYDAYYLRAVKVRNLIRAEFDRVFREVDYLLSPTTPTPAFRLGEKVDDPLAMYLSDIFTVPANLAGIPAISLPAGMSEAGLPLALQLWGPRGSDYKLLAAAARLEKIVGYQPHWKM